MRQSRHAGVVSLVTTGSLLAQDPTALTILTQATRAIGAVGASSAVLTGTVTYTAGSDSETGSVELKAAGLSNARVRLSLNGTYRVEVQRQGAGEWQGADRTRHVQAQHNTFSSAAWFFPPLLINSWIADSSLTVSSVGIEQWNGSSVQHLHCVRSPRESSDQITTALVQQASATDLYLDTTTLLPAGIEYNAHPDNNELQNIPVRIEFGDYRAVNGAIKAPYHIQKFLQGSLLLDITLSGVELNAAIPATDFILP